MFFSESCPPKPNANANSKDVNFKETALEGNAVVNLSSPSRSISSADDKEVHTNIQDLKQVFSRTPKEVKKTPLVDTSSGTSTKFEIPVEDNEGRKSQESLVSLQTDAYLGMTGQSKQCERTKLDTKTGDLGGQVIKGDPQDYGKASVEWKDASPKGIERPKLIPPVPTPRPRSNILPKENTNAIEESPLSDPSNVTSHEVYRYHQDRNSDVPELRPEITEKKGADSAYLQVGSKDHSLKRS